MMLVVVCVLCGCATQPTVGPFTMWYNNEKEERAVRYVSSQQWDQPRKDQVFHAYALGNPSSPTLGLAVDVRDMGKVVSRPWDYTASLVGDGAFWTGLIALGVEIVQRMNNNSECECRCDCGSERGQK